MTRLQTGIKISATRGYQLSVADKIYGYLETHVFLSSLTTIDQIFFIILYNS